MSRKALHQKECADFPTVLFVALSVASVTGKLGSYECFPPSAAWLWHLFSDTAPMERWGLWPLPLKLGGFLRLFKMNRVQWKWHYVIWVYVIKSDAVSASLLGYSLLTPSAAMDAPRPPQGHWAGRNNKLTPKLTTRWDLETAERDAWAAPSCSLATNRWMSF